MKFPLNFIYQSNLYFFCFSENFFKTKIKTQLRIVSFGYIGRDVSPKEITKINKNIYIKNKCLISDKKLFLKRPFFMWIIPIFFPDSDHIFSAEKKLFLYIRVRSLRSYQLIIIQLISKWRKLILNFRENQKDLNNFEIIFNREYLKGWSQRS